MEDSWQGALLFVPWQEMCYITPHFLSLGELKILLGASDKSLVYGRTIQPLYFVPAEGLRRPQPRRKPSEGFATTVYTSQTTKYLKPSAGTKSKGLTVLPYIKDLSEALRRAMNVCVNITM
ncbi:hypothetical protein Bbelb_266040 [Branchiostoma belcheri]|nr:hypothetical protein Bbelb_266040 [Branchiostoma belcheri]